MYIQVTNNHGSTRDPPVTIKASVVSGLRTLPTERLKELAQIITDPAENLGLNHSLFGEVKKHISLSSFLNHSLHAQIPIHSPSPAPSPWQIYGTGPAPTSSPPSLPDFFHSIPPCSNCYVSVPPDAGELFPPSSRYLPGSNSPKSSETHSSLHSGLTDPPVPSTSYSNQISPSTSPPAGSAPQISPSDPYGPWRPVKRNMKYLVSPPRVLSSSSPSWSCKLLIFLNMILIPLVGLEVWVLRVLDRNCKTTGSLMV